jgi:hypothetical protein
MVLQHSAEDGRIVETQLGRAVRGRWAVAARCHLGLPTVIESHPRFENGQPFPTLFWLTCPVLVKRISRLEAGAEMSRLTERIGDEPALGARIERAGQRYRARRDSHEVIPDAGAPPGGGPGRIKCLHAHVAHELADPPNPVGARSLAATGWPDCIAPCVAESG